MVSALAIGLGILGVVVLWAILSFNKIIRLENRSERAWSDIDVQLKRRADLIPNLVDTVKGYVKHEKTVLTDITKARSAMMGADSRESKAKAGNMLADALKTLFAVAENYPKLKANENFKLLQEELSGTESKIAFARQYYNDAIMLYNNTIESFPSNMIANMMGRKEKQQLQIETAERKLPKVEF